MPQLLLALLLLPYLCYAQQLPSVSEKTRELRREVGFVPFYVDEQSGKIWMELSRFEQEFLYVMSLPAGIGSNDIGLDRGLLGGGRLVKWVRSGRKVLLVQPNYDYRAVGGSVAERRAVAESFAQSTLWGFTVEAETGASVLVDATEFLMRDALQIAVRLRKQQQGNYSIDKSRCAPFPERIKNFPFNSEWEVSLTFVSQDGSAGNWIQAVVPSPEAITVRIHHSFVQLPDQGFKPRRFDPRSGYIPISYFDYATPITEPIDHYVAIRHRLQKRDPGATISEPVKPIVYYLDNGTPEPIRSALLEGASWWNQAFEAAGYRNAFQVKVLPDTADPMDIRYNMINWVHRSTRGWSYGASVVDPRTGEIIKGQVTLGSLRVRQDYLIAQGLLAPFEQGLPVNNRMLKMALERLRQLSAHEVGHTLGLMHNYASSVNNRASVMDYPHPLVRLDAQGGIALDSAYDQKIGDWDKIAIQWGYADFSPGTDESAALNRTLTEATQKGFLFISDRDARAPGGLHPLAHLWDNGRDAVEELNEVMKVRARALSQFGERNIRPGTPLAFLEDVLVPVYFYHRYQVEAVTKIIGGMNYHYSLRGDGQPAPEVISKDRQLRALDALIGCLSPDVLALPESVVRLIPPRPSGFEFTRELFKKRTGLGFDALAPAETAADLPLSFLLQGERLSRLAQQAVQGGLGVEELVDRLITATWKAPRKSGMQGLIQQQTEQVLLTYLLAASVEENSSFAARGPIVSALEGLKAYIGARYKSVVDSRYKSHLQLALERLKAPEKARPSVHAPIPPGAPIGCASIE